MVERDARAVLYPFRMPTEEEVDEALEEVIDPELGLDFVSWASSTTSTSKAARSS